MESFNSRISPSKVKKVCTNLFFYIFARTFYDILSRGVMVALQILVLPVQVRILARQLEISLSCESGVRDYRSYNFN